jgi:hypothetical protein
MGDRMSLVPYAQQPSPAVGPLVVAQSNPRYFTVASNAVADGTLVYLTGSHVNNNLHDGLGFGPECPEEPERFDFGDYLDFLEAHGHNFIRLWRWEQFRGQLPMGGVHLCMTPQPWARTGPGAAKDGKPKFDLDRFDPAFFDRLRERVGAAGERGIYVSVMLFEGFSLHLTAAPDNVEGHPFHLANNVNRVGIRSIDDYQVLPLDPRVQAIQAAYVRKVVDTVQDLPNVLYEVANESSGGGSIDPQFAEQMQLGGVTAWGDSTAWQYWVIDLVKRYEEERDYQKHPIGMTMQFPVPDPARVNAPLFDGPADWVSPGSGVGPTDERKPGGDWLADPPPSDGRKVVISDTDHYAPFQGDALWAWKSFLRGHNPILYDLGIVGGAKPADPAKSGPGAPAYEAFEAARHALGDTRRYPQKVRLAAMAPRGDLSSTGYALASPGQEYLVLQPAEQGGAFTVALEAGAYAAEWQDVATRETRGPEPVTVDGAGPTSFVAPFAQGSPAVLHLKRLGR